MKERSKESKERKAAAVIVEENKKRKQQQPHALVCPRARRVKPPC